MDKELIEKMKKNKVIFDKLTEIEKALLKEIATQNPSDILFVKDDRDLMSNSVYRIQLDYTPEPEVIRCEVMLQNNNVVYIIESQRAGILLYKALGNKNFIEYEWADGTRDCNIRRHKGKGQPAEYPKYVLFAK